ncbi:MAG: outer membrane protein transport protein [Muribaculaceae bacterium]|nr:outer membrane protein transport protein [Muribaculaceae bacterium]
MKIFKHILAAAVIAACCAGTAQAQEAMSPYSKFGYGLLNDNATSAQRAMGGVGYAMRSGRQVNVMNPASYAAIDSMTFLFDMGIDLTSLHSSENGNKTQDFGGGLDYITMQFPLCRYVGASIGLLPYSSVGYSFGSQIVNGTSSRQGSGGINQLYAGIAGQPFEGFSVGANVSYMFGTTINDIYATSVTGSISLFEKVVQVRDWHVQLGMQYGRNFGRQHRATVGVTYSPGKDLLGHAWAVQYDVNQDSKPDTIGYTSLRHGYSLPDTWGAGINYEWNDRLMVEVDFTYQNWAKAKYSSIDGFQEPTQFADRYRIGAGAQYRHNIRGNYLQRIQWRAGAYTNRDYITVNGNNVREYGVTCGFGLPTPGGNKTMVNISLQYINRQATPAKLLTENYFNITLGINLNERWFMPNKLR